MLRSILLEVAIGASTGSRRHVFTVLLVAGVVLMLTLLFYPDLTRRRLQNMGRVLVHTKRAVLGWPTLAEGGGWGREGDGTVPFQRGARTRVP